ncbi:DUF4397 domain-containing protein [Egicoccus halophilus]|uniref:DUF4397 domain-containing protein n=1 Tax=Egicoccus halophilus TaxID=1670830 RepID=A0A8J3A5S6_9ACTN|nr:DUF4397 domain-containing protein [Egicoccus halophilus]GGI03427.1 hypothetical protein GCM10011354_03980 [Egicoccus halophilus]
MRFRVSAAAAAAMLVAAPAAAIADNHDDHDTAEVVAVHGLPQSVFDTLGADSTAVDVYVAGSYDDALTTFEFGDVGTLEVPPGAYDLEVFPAGGDTSGDPVLTLSTPELAAGVSASVVAQLDEAGETPSLAAYINENDATGIQVFHTAAFGAVDIVAGGEVALAGAANGDTARIDVPGGTTVDGVGVAPAGGDVAIDLGAVEVPEDTLVLAYAIGSADDETLQVVTATTSVAGGEDGEMPTRVDAGSAGLAANQGIGLGVAVLLLAGVALLTAPVTASVVRRRR